ncbi:MAG: ATP-binding protein [Phycisphaeraceae bacterium]
MEVVPPFGQTRMLEVTDPSGVGDARRQAATMARQQGLDEDRRGRVALVVTEAGNNLVRHAKDGCILLQRVAWETHRGVEVIALDRGPGMNDVSRCLRDGYSTIGTSGTGLGAMSRLADDFTCYSRPGQGSAVLARVWESQFNRPRPPLEVGGLSVPIAGEKVGGDAWAVRPTQRGLRLLMADGLGHGPDASEASQRAVERFLELDLPPQPLLNQMHRSLRSTRGAALAVAEVSDPPEPVRFWGIGNISATILTGSKTHHLVSGHGTVGLQVPQLREYTGEWSEDSLLVMHSDGLTDRWDLRRYAGLARQDPSLVAGVLYRDHHRLRDDVSVAVVRPRRPARP